MWYTILLFIIIALPDFYIWQNYVRRKKTIYSVFYWLPLLAMIVSFILGMKGILSYYTLRVFFVLFICVAIPKLVFAVIAMLGKLLSKVTTKASMIRNGITLSVVIVVIGSGIYGFTVGWKRLDIVEQVVESPDIPPAFNGFRIVQLSDLHVGTFDHDPAVLDSIVSIVNSLHPDVILFTGDLINVYPDELHPYMYILSTLKAKYGVFSVMGNHDYAYYDKKASQTELDKRILQLQQMQRKMGWDLLLNENRLIKIDGQTLAIVGVENDSKPPHPARGDLAKAMEGVPDDAFVILMSHDPSHWKRDVVPNSNIPVTLSGHTHAMQFRIGNISPSQLIYEEWGGEFDDKDQMLYVNVGTGSSVPFRLGAWSEIGLITLKCED